MKYLNVADLHVHTSASDGACSIAEVVSLAADAGLEIIAVTDHDSVNAFDSPIESPYVQVIPGVELSAELGEREVHILGYCIDTNRAPLRTLLSGLQEARRARLHAILDKLSELDVDIDPQEVLDVATGSSVGRLHIAELLIDKGFVRSLHAAFRDFLGPDGKAFVPKVRLSVPGAIELIHNSHGAAVLAHPGSVFLPEEIRSFAAAGLDGIEAHYPRHSQIETLAAVDLARELGLVVTGGSDFHGRRSTEVPIGASRISRAEVETLHERSRLYAAGHVS